MKKEDEIVRNRENVVGGIGIQQESEGNNNNNNNNNNHSNNNNQHHMNNKNENDHDDEDDDDEEAQIISVSSGEGSTESLSCDGHSITGTSIGGGGLLGSSSNGRDHGNSSGYYEKIEIGSKETKRVWYTRALVILVLIGVATTISVLVYNYSRSVEQSNFELDFTDKANLVASEFIDGAERRLAAIQSFATEITSYVKSNSNVSWPNVALPDFERRATYTLQLSQVLSVIFFPIITQQTRTSWERFSVENQGWMKEGLAVQGIPMEDWDQQNIDILEKTWGVKNQNLSFPEQIFRVSGIGIEDETGPGPFAPWWQFAPVFPVPTLVNYNGFSHPTREAPLTSIIENQKILVTQAWDYADENDPTTVGKKAALNLFLQHGKYSGSYEAGPASDLYVPIFDDFHNNSNLVGEIAAYVYWQVYFEDILSKNDIGYYVILENTCNQTYTYRMDGRKAKYIGQGDLHDMTYDYLRVSTEYGSSFIIYNGDPKKLPDGQCLYRIRIYPSKELHETFMTNAPLNFTLALVGTFALTCMVFLLYDYLVEKRQKLVLKTAVQTSAVVASLFPEEVRQRILHDKENEKKAITKNQQQKQQQQQQMQRALMGGANNNNNNNNSINNNSIPGTGDHFKPLSRSESEELEDEKSMAIADLYPNCTVQFCDIVGFTKWSSSREPWEVFKLLETMYKVFDRNARRLGVFKVETIGDCYVAVTGLPHPQSDHAVIMAKFATSCITKVRKITDRLANRLGDDTRDLVLRIGMHSGPVTAGVLRGEKARFQLFGDTVNTAARMESTSMPMKVQLSTSTATLLQRANRHDWLRIRENEVDVKGKGRLQTYWLETMVVSNNYRHSSPASSAAGKGSGGSNYAKSVNTDYSNHSLDEDLPHGDVVVEEASPGKSS